MSSRNIFIKRLNQALFRKQLANKPRPWRVTLLLELVHAHVYGGWTLIREPVLRRLSRCKDLQFQALLMLVDNYVPMSLSIYSVLIKSNHYDGYYRAMMQLWVMFWTYKRRHYDKSPLIWISQRIYWRNINHPLYDAVRYSMEQEDEYPVEHFTGKFAARRMNTTRQRPSQHHDHGDLPSKLSLDTDGYHACAVR